MLRKGIRLAGTQGYLLRLLFVIMLIGTLPQVVLASEKKPFLQQTDFTGHVDKAVEVKVVMPSTPLLGGIFYSVVVDPLSYPGNQPPEILSGLPTTKVVCHRPGLYRLHFRINKISKESCATASADILTDQEVTLHISR